MKMMIKATEKNSLQIPRGPQALLPLPITTPTFGSSPPLSNGSMRKSSGASQLMCLNPGASTPPTKSTSTGRTSSTPSTSSADRFSPTSKESYSNSNNTGHTKEDWQCRNVGLIGADAYYFYIDHAPLHAFLRAFTAICHCCVLFFAT